MANLQVGEDEGYIDYILILSKDSMKDKLNEIEEAIAQFIREYEALVDAFHSIDEEQRGVHFMKCFQVIFNKAIKFS
jgi:tRNA(Ser,Leu) C12 N-acetylase TAN1